MKIKGILVLLVLIVLSSCRSVVAPEFDLNPVVKSEKSENLSYIDIKDESELIVKVKVEDKLSLDNSFVSSKRSFYALRTVTVLEVFKQTGKDDQEPIKEEDLVKAEDQLVIKEAAAIDNLNIYYTSNHMPLAENNEYVLFLKKVNDRYEVVDGDNGVVDINNIINNQNTETAVNVIFEYFKPTINNIALEYVPLKATKLPSNVKFERFTVKTDKIDIPVRIGQDTTTQKEYIAIGNIFLELESPILNKIK